MADEITGLQCTSGTGDIKLLTEKHDSIERIKLIDEIWDEVKGMTQEMVKHNAFMKTMLTDMTTQNKLLIETISKVITGASTPDEAKSVNLIDSLSKIVNGEDTPDEAKSVNLIDSLSKIVTGKDTPDDAKTENNLADVTSKVITGKKVDELVLGEDGGESGVYDTTLNGRIQKTTELITGILVGLFTEDEIKTKLEGLDINKVSSIVENLGAMESNASFMKNDLRRSSDFSNADGDEHNPSSPLPELTRAVKSLVVQHAWMGIKSDKMSAAMGVKQDGVPSQEFFNEAKAANRKVAEDTVNQILNKDSNPSDDGDYPGNEGYE